MHIPDTDLPKLKSALEMALLELHTQANERCAPYAEDITKDRIWIMQMLGKICRHQMDQPQTSLYQNEFDFDFEGTPV